MINLVPRVFLPINYIVIDIRLFSSRTVVHSQLCQKQIPRIFATFCLLQVAFGVLSAHVCARRDRSGLPLCFAASFIATCRSVCWVMVRPLSAPKRGARRMLVPRTHQNVQFAWVCQLSRRARSLNLLCVCVHIGGAWLLFLIVRSGGILLHHCARRSFHHRCWLQQLIVTCSGFQIGNLSLPHARSRAALSLPPISLVALSRGYGVRP